VVSPLLPLSCTATLLPPSRFFLVTLRRRPDLRGFFLQSFSSVLPSKVLYISIPRPLIVFLFFALECYERGRFGPLGTVLKRMDI